MSRKILTTPTWRLDLPERTPPRVGDFIIRSNDVVQIVHIMGGPPWSFTVRGVTGFSPWAAFPDATVYDWKWRTNPEKRSVATDSDSGVA